MNGFTVLENQNRLNASPDPELNLEKDSAEKVCGNGSERVPSFVLDFLHIASSGGSEIRKAKGSKFDTSWKNCRQYCVHCVMSQESSC